MSLLKAGHLRRITCRIAACLALALGPTSLIPGQDQVPTSLEIVPESAAFYTASMNHAAQMDALFNSRAWEQLMDTTVARNMRRAYRKGRRHEDWDQFGWNNPFAEYLEFYSYSAGSMSGRMTLGYLRQILGNECFVYADRDWITLSEAMSAAYEDARTLSQGIDPDGTDEDQIHDLLDIVQEHLADANTPTLVMGTVLDDTAAVKSLLQIAESGFNQWLENAPPEMEYLKEAFHVIERDDSYLLNLALESAMIPWNTLEDDPDLGPYLADIRAILANKSVHVTVGVKGAFLLVSIGPSGDHVLNLGSGSLLIDREEFAVLRQKAESHRMTSVWYTSEELSRHSKDRLPDFVDSFAEMARITLESDPEIREQLEGFGTELNSIAAELKQDLRQWTGEPGAYLGFSWMNGAGYEGLIYDWSENPYLDSSKPLTILEHVGQRPALVLAGRNAGVPEQFAMARKWFGKASDLVERYGPKLWTEEEARLFDRLYVPFRHVMSVLAEATEKEFLPAVEGLQTAVVLDFATAKPSWHQSMAPAENDLPLPSLSIVLEHRDKRAIQSYLVSILTAARRLADLMHQIPGSEFPDGHQIPDPVHDRRFGGDLYSYPLPIEKGLDSSITPHLLVTERWLIAGYSLDQSERLVNGSSPTPEGLLSTDRNLASACYYDNREWIDAAYSWCLYGIQMYKQDTGEKVALGKYADNDLLAFNESELMEALDHVVALVKCFHSGSSIQYLEDDVQVTHFRLHFRDVPEK